MNAFILDRDPTVAAQMHCDKHVVKMPTESAQVIWTGLWLQGIIGPMRPTHMNHPLVVWSLSSATNLTWLHRLGMSLCDEYEFRYGRRHRSRGHLEAVPSALRIDDISADHQINFVQCMPEHCKRSDPVEGYRNLYLTDKSHLLKYTRREPPGWIPPGMAMYKLDSKLRIKREMSHA